MFVFCFLLINLPENLLGQEDTPYEFTNRGYYERFAEGFERDNNYNYYQSEVYKFENKFTP